MTTDFLSACEKVCEEAARKAGAALKEKLGTVNIKTKSNPNDLVTDADTAAQRIIEETVLGAFPDHRFLGEEGFLTASSQCGTSEYCWIVDPLDGTTNFVHGCPMFGPSIALTCGNEVLCGVFYNPISEEFFSAAKGQGAFLNGKRLKTSCCSSPEKALVSVSFSSQFRPDFPDLRAFMNTLPKCQSLRRTGSTAMNLAYTAAGYFDSTWAFSCHPWDIAAGVLLVSEAGGSVSKPDGSPFDFCDPSPVCASATEALHREIVLLIQ